ncbi:protein-tyrosine phosphatase family protein [Aliiglaciecola litoralis]|uniref:Tyrosine specific protein phosphatases domain-containing protein n=1 Tax=Aliiglaciecola litoralis TaxID=582857 RepID=A0ABP3WPA8_9ALTE
MKEVSVEFETVLNGALAIGHRPRLKNISVYKELGVTHVWTLLSEKEGALEIKSASRKAGLEWIWLPLANGKPPEEKMLPQITDSFSECKSYLNDNAKIYLHCSAGIHRTGMISYAFLRYLKISEQQAMSKLLRMRALTQGGVGHERLEWGNRHFGDSI